MRYLYKTVYKDFLCCIPLKKAKRQLRTFVINFCNSMKKTSWIGTMLLHGRSPKYAELSSLRCLESRNCCLITVLVISTLVCTRGCGLQEETKTVVGIVNRIRGRAFNHRQFHNHLVAFDAEYGNVLFYNSFRWLSHGAVLEKFVALFLHIVSFLEEIAKLNTQFKIRLCVLADIFGHLNRLNMLLQG